VCTVVRQNPPDPPNCYREEGHLLTVVMTPGTLDECVLAIKEDVDIVRILLSSFIHFSNSRRTKLFSTLHSNRQTLSKTNLQTTNWLKMTDSDRPNFKFVSLYFAISFFCWIRIFISLLGGAICQCGLCQITLATCLRFMFTCVAGVWAQVVGGIGGDVCSQSRGVADSRHRQWTVDVLRQVLTLVDWLPLPPLCAYTPVSHRIQA